jgi:dTMP kinase
MIKPEDGIKRILSNSLTREVNRLDKEKMSMHQLVYEGYRKLIDENRNKTIVEIDASKPVQEVFNDTIKVVQTLVDKHYAQ